jgi:hypothetical protein
MAGVLKTRVQSRVDDVAGRVAKPLLGMLDSLEQDISVGRSTGALLE